MGIPRGPGTGSDTGTGTGRIGRAGHRASRALTALRTGTGTLPAAARRAVRVTLAACVGFYTFLHVLRLPVPATYALFAAVALAVLSRIPGTGRQRSAQLVRVLPVACVLVTLGTLLAVRNWAAVAGMLVIGFCLAFGAAAGPRQAGAAPGLQLLFILPCFPPFAPDELGERLLGVVVGILLLILAEAWVLPDPPEPSYRDRVARAAEVAARCAAALAAPPYALSRAAAEEAVAAGESLRPSRSPEAERPAGPGVRERGSAHSGLAARTLLARLHALPVPAAGVTPLPESLDLLRGVEAAAREIGALLAAPSAETSRPRGPDGAARLALAAARAGAAAVVPALPADRRRQASVLEVADAALVLGEAVDIAVWGRGAVGDGRDTGRFWYARRSEPYLWWHRLAAHAGPRSVYFQNAVRIALALAVARTIAGLDTLPHGFWAMLAVLSLTRTTAVQTRHTVRSALIGTFLGAMAAGAVLTLAGTASTAYAFILPPLMLFAFTTGPLHGVGWGQAMFTNVVAMAFAQLSPSDWRLAEYRFLDVLIGSGIGLVVGLLAWPRGAHDELGRAVARLLRAAAGEVAATTRDDGPAGSEDLDSAEVQRALTLAESAYAQYQGEAQRPAGPGPDWQCALMAGHHVLWGARRVRASPGGLPAAPVAERRMREYGAWVAEGFLTASERYDVLRRAAAPPGRSPAGSGPEEADSSLDAPPRYYTALAWLDFLTADLVRMAASHPAQRMPVTP
ncbi:FUSC family protein [Streptomyces sp. A1136]|uniref:FUSC family protein n=1 Tax=Streptomyces sp. A1136 TaxID=2563102 RepID=UPI00109E3F8D|nr:FUSC family protein [Streptomyces sp. A1136]THA50335.1 FUSC family protein [Streptomyces sp. A1136]